MANERFLTVDALLSALAELKAKEPSVGRMLVSVGVDDEGAGGIASRVTIARNTAHYVGAPYYATGAERAGQPDE